MLRSFDYNSKGETKTRNVFVLNENDSYIHGLDFGYLTEEEQSDVLEKLKEHKVKDIAPRGQAEPIEGYNKDWNKAWRCFKKSSIQVKG